MGFTSFSNRPDLSASEIVRIANRYFTLMQGSIDRQGGCSDKFLGDAGPWLSERPGGRAGPGSEGAWRPPETDQRNRPRKRSQNIVSCGQSWCLLRESLCRRSWRQAEKQLHDHRAGRQRDVWSRRCRTSTDCYGRFDRRTTMVGRGEGERAREQCSRANRRYRPQGFCGGRSIYTVVPKDDPGLSAFEAGRKALEQGKVREARAARGRRPGNSCSRRRKRSAPATSLRRWRLGDGMGLYELGCDPDVTIKPHLGQKAPHPPAERPLQIVKASGLP